MEFTKRFNVFAVFAILLGLNTSIAASDSVAIYKTNLPSNDSGYDVSSDQSVAIRFSPIDNVTLAKLELWFGNNGLPGNEVTITLREDTLLSHDSSQPGDNILETWTIKVSSHSWAAEKETLVSIQAPELAYNKRYWIVAESSTEPGYSPIWNVSESHGNHMSIGYYGRMNPSSGLWSTGYSSIPTLSIYGALPGNGFGSK